VGSITRVEDLAGVEGRKNYFMINPDKIVVETGHNLRKAFNGIEDLAQSIMTSGLERHLTIRREKDQLILVDGERRLRAIRYANKELGAAITAVPCDLKDRPDEAERTIVQLVSNAHAQDFRPLEQAEGFKRLMNWGWDEAKIAGQLGCSEGHVKGRLRLLTATSAAKKALNDGLVSMSAVLELLQRFPEDNDAQNKALEDAIKSGTGTATIATVKRTAKRAGREASARKRMLPFKEAEDLALQIQKHLKTQNGTLKASDRTELEGVRKGLRIAMGIETAPAFDEATAN
jgi:ParB/RepB/Spo0J family partition protein